MNRRRDGKRRWSRYFRRGTAGLVGLIILGFLLLQGLLATSWMRNKVAGKLSQRIGGLEVEIGSLSWTPWSGAKMEGLEVKQPAVLQELVPTPLLVVDEIHAWPDYGAALKRQFSVSEVTVLRPKLHVTVDMLVSIAAASMPPTEPPAIAAVVPRPGPVENPQPEAAPAEIKSSLTEEEPAVTKQPTSQPEAAPRPEPKAVGRRMRVLVEDGAFELVRVGMKESLAGGEGVNLDLPLFGEAGESGSSVALIECLGQVVDEELEIQVKTEGTGVQFLFPGDPEEDFGVFGSCSFGLVRGLPFQTDLGLRLSSFERIKVSEALSGQCGEVQARIQGGGWLQAPGSWRGVSAFEGKRPQVGMGGQLVNFDSASAVVQLAEGVIQSPDFRVMGDSASILGNGWITSRDGVAVVRLVVPSSVVSTINGALNQRVPESVFSFKPLDPGNRWFSDVSIWREEAGWSVGFGDGGSIVPLDELGKIE